MGMVCLSAQMLFFEWGCCFFESKCFFLNVDVVFWARREVNVGANREVVDFGGLSEVGDGELSQL